MTTRVLVADDHELIRAGVTMLLSAHPDLLVVGQATSGEEAVDRARDLEVDVVVIDLRMPGMGGVEATRRLVTENEERPDRLVKVLVLTTFSDDESVYESLRAGASGYLVKDTAAEHLVEAVLAVARGDSWIDSAVAGQVLAALRRAAPHRPAESSLVERLTSREREVLRLMALGLSNAEIRDHLVLSEATVRTHVSRVLMKTGSRDRAAAVVLAYQSHLVRPGPD